jgi:hypothetical protein
MERQSTELDELSLQAATLAFALLRFESGAAHPYLASTPPGMPAVGIDAYIFWPSATRVKTEEVPSFLAGLSSPALLAPTTVRGMVSLTLVGELEGARAVSAQKLLSNQQTAIASISARDGLTDESRVLLEFDDEAHVVSMPILRKWSERFGVLVGWNLKPLQHDDRASARLMLYRSDGGSSWGGSCPIRAPEPPKIKAG